jgi:hypothetical protein
LYFKKLIYLGLSWEERLTISELAHDAPYGPYVHLFGVPVTEEELRTSIPSGSHIICHLWVLFRLRYIPCESEVTKFKIFLRIDEQILRFYISMHYVHGMTIVDSLEKLENILFY